MADGTGDSTSTIGPLLQGARTAKGLTIEAAAAGSKVPLSFVRLMEQEQFHLVPDSLYLTRFLTEYAAFLGLDPKQLLAQLKEQVDSARIREMPHPTSSIGSRTDLRRLLIYLLPVAAVIPLIFIGLSLFSERPPVLPPPRQAELPESQGTVGPLPEAATAVPPSPHGSSAGEGQPEGLTPAHQVTAPSAQEPQGPPPRYALKAEAKQTTWLGVSADGAPRKNILLHPGQKAQWSANRGFVVTIGNSEGVALLLNDRPIPLKGRSGQVIRNLTLPGDGASAPAGQ